MTVESMSEALSRLHDQGYVDDLVADHGGLLNLTTGEVSRAETNTASEIVRFEGATDPDDEAIVVAISKPDGCPIGTLVTPYGPDASADEATVLRLLRDGRACG